MKALKNGTLLVLLASLVGCGQPLVQFVDMSAADDLSVHDDLSSRDLGVPDLALVHKDLAIVDDDAGNGDGFSTQALRVLSVTPLDQAVGVPTFRAMTATFNHAMDPTTLDALTFTLHEQGAPYRLAGSVTYTASTDTAIFTPSSELLTATTYIATITTSALDTSGHSLAADYTWSFTTAATACGMPSVYLGSAGNFGVLAGSALTSSGATIINGDVCVSPGTVITGFGASPGVAGPGIVNGTQRTPPDPVAAQAASDAMAAYSDAAARSLCFVTVADGELGGTTRTPGLYRSGTAAFTITSSDLVLDAQGDPDGIFIFQMPASTLTIADGRAVTLIGGAKAANVFWSVGSSAVIGMSASVKGTILADQSITMSTGASIEGRALALVAAVTLLSDTITVP